MELTVKELMELVEYIKECEECYSDQISDIVDELKYSVDDLYYILSKEEKPLSDRNDQDGSLSI